MAITDRLARYAGVRLSRRMTRAMPIIGTALAVAMLAATVKRKGWLGGMLDTGLNATPFVGAVKTAFEVVRGRDLFPDRAARRSS